METLEASLDEFSSDIPDWKTLARDAVGWEEDQDNLAAFIEYTIADELNHMPGEDAFMPGHSVFGPVRAHINLLMRSPASVQENYRRFMVKRRQERVQSAS